MKFTRRQNRLLQLAAEIVRLRDQIQLLEVEFHRVATEKFDPNEIPTEEPISVLPKFTPIKQQVLSFFTSRSSEDIWAREVVMNFSTTHPQTIHTTLSKLTRDGLLVRVRQGVYRLAGDPNAFGFQLEPKAAISEETKAETPKSKDSGVSS